MTVAQPAPYCMVQVVEKESGWPVPLVELRTVHHQRFVSDNAGIIALDLPELWGRETWFDVFGHGYECPRDGFGYRGVRLTPVPGGNLRIELSRTIIAKRLGRLTGAGLFAESQKLGRDLDWKESGLLGCDSIQKAVYRGRLFWAWGDSLKAGYPLGIFDMSGATTGLRPLATFQPPLKLSLNYFTGADRAPRGIAKLPGDGPTWLSAFVALPDKSGSERLVATYAKIKPPMDAYERGLCVWNDKTESFERLKVLWTRSGSSNAPPILDGHPAFHQEEGSKWVLFGNPLPTLRCPATFEAWSDTNTWELLQPQKSFTSPNGGDVKPHSGSICWNDFRKRWVTVFMETFGKPSAFGEIWYAEADKPTGPWSKAVKVLSHENYTFYNPRIHPELSEGEARVLIFEGTYTADFADKPNPTPRYNYNQMLYRLDLDDPRLKPAQEK